MGIFSWVFGKATAGIIDSAGTAVQKVYRTVKGDKAEVEAAIADEQLATLASHAAEFAERGTRTKLDSVIDFINRLPRPLIVFWALSFLIVPYFFPDDFLEYVFRLSMIPDEIWTLILAVFSFFLGSRIISQDIRKPKLTEEEKKAAIKIIKDREAVILENRTPLIVEVPATRKPEPPPWAQAQIDLAKKPLPVPKEVFKPQGPPPIQTGRPIAIDNMIDALLSREGGYINHPDDRGGATNHGITINTLSAWRQKECTVDDVKALSDSEAAEIYRTNYYFFPGIDSLPYELQAHVMDCGVNHGPQTGVKMLQKALNSFSAEIKEDGVVGPMTREACTRYDHAKINNKLVDIRLKFYESLVRKNPSQKVFIVGWRKRARSFLV